MIQLESRDALGITGHAMVCIMKKQTVLAVALPVPADALNQLGAVPFMNEHQVGAVQSLIEIQSLRLVLN